MKKKLVGAAFIGLGVLLLSGCTQNFCSPADRAEMLYPYEQGVTVYSTQEEFDTYKVGTVVNSCSTMHKIHSRDLRMEDFSTEHILPEGIDIFKQLIDWLNRIRLTFLETKDKRFWYPIIQLLPCCYNQKRTVMLNYETIAKIRAERKGHKLDEWNQLIEAFETLPYVKDLC